MESIQPCPFCGKDFMHYEYLMEHIERRHTDNSAFISDELQSPSPPQAAPPPIPPRRPPPIPQIAIASPEDEAPPLPTRPPPPRPSSAPTIQLVHSESEGSSASEDEEDDEDDFVSCPLEECGEQVLASEINEHIELHQTEQLVLEGGSSPSTQPLALTNHRYQDNNNYSSSSSSSAVIKSSHPSFNSFYAPDQPNAKAFPDTTMDLYHPKEAHLQPYSPLSLPAPMSEPVSAPASTIDSVSSSQRTRRRRKRHDKGLSWGGIKRKYLRLDGLLGLETSKPKRAKPSKKDSSLRLGKKELGPYAYEEKMPRWLHDQLDRGPKIFKLQQPDVDGRTTTYEIAENETPGIIPMLARLSELDPYVGTAYYCHPATMHICKTRKEGGFCGYRNIQMQVSYLQGAKATGHEVFPPSTPGVLWLQDQIEDAWDHGISEISRSMIGKLKGTRKWIGTLEANALYAHLGVECEVYSLSDSRDQKYAHENLLDKVEAYFEQSFTNNTNFAGRPAPQDRINRTLMPPIYLQQPGHSVTIVGLEKHLNDQRYLIVLDPMYLTSRAMNQLLDVGPRRVKRPRAEVMDIYRRGEERLWRHKDFEILMLTSPPPVFPAWDILNTYSCQTVFYFFDFTTQTYEIWPTWCFLPEFTWYLYGGQYSLRDARLVTPSLAVQQSIPDNAFLPGTIDFRVMFQRLCVPRVFGRWSIESTRVFLDYDAWLLPSTAHTSQTGMSEETCLFAIAGIPCECSCGCGLDNLGCGATCHLRLCMPYETFIPVDPASYLAQPRHNPQGGGWSWIREARLKEDEVDDVETHFACLVDATLDAQYWHSELSSYSSSSTASLLDRASQLKEAMSEFGFSSTDLSIDLQSVTSGGWEEGSWLHLSCSSSLVLTPSACSESSFELVDPIPLIENIVL